MVLITPTSIASTGTGNSSSILATGSVTFSSCASLSLNGVFSATYDNYMITVRARAASITSINMRLRVGGTDNSTASSYVRQRVEAYGNTITADRNTDTSWGSVAYSDSVQRSGFSLFVFGPNLAQPTAVRSVNVYDYQNVSFLDISGTHNQSTAYDGVTIFTSVSSISGLLTVFGFNQ